MPDGGVGRSSAVGPNSGMPRCGQGGPGVRGQVGRSAGVLRRWPVFKTVLSSAIFGISGITKDASGNILGNCTVNLFADGSEQWLQQTISDDAGFFSFTGIGVGAIFMTAYRVGSPEVDGISIHNVSPIVVG